MSSSNLLSIGARALTANASALETTGHNIANVNTPGYSRQTVVMRSSPGQLTGAGFFGKGVDVATVERAHSDFLMRQVVQTRSIAAAEQIRATRLAQVEPIFPTGDNGLGAAIDGVLNAFADVAATPSDTSARQVVLARADEMAARFNAAAQRLQSLDTDVGVELGQTVDRVNQIASQIASLNGLIASAGGLQHAPNDLLDQRDSLVTDLSQQANITTVIAGDGAMNVYLGGTQPLVLSRDLTRLRVDTDPQDPTRRVVALNTPGGPVYLNESHIGGGELAGLLAFERTDLASARDQLGRLTLATAMLLNGEHRLGLDSSGKPGGDLFRVTTESMGVAATDNQGNARVSVTAFDATALHASDYELHFQNAQVDVVRRSDGLVRSFSGTPIEVDGVRIEVAQGSAQPGDSFVLQPLTLAAGSVQLRLSAAAQLAVAEPVSAQPAAGNRGSLQIQAIQAESAHANLTAPVTLTFHAGGSYDVSGAGTGNPVGLAWGSGDTIRFNGWAVKLGGAPAEGDTITVGPAPVPVRDAHRGHAMLNLRDRPVIDGATLANGYAAVLGDVGTRVQAARYASEVSTAMSDQAQASQSELTGVNLDEEAARLLQYQQAYQASARILQVAQSVFDTLLQGLR